jgi:hypothetical protein
MIGDNRHFLDKSKMSLGSLESEIEQYLTVGDSPPLASLAGGAALSADPGKLHVIKYMPTKWLEDALQTRSLYASETPGYTWGDAVYVAPLQIPCSTMMYGPVGVVGWLDMTGLVFYDAVDVRGIAYYQEWIRHFPDLYTQLTTTVHSNEANREFRNRFRTRFGIDCICFRPDESCSGYVDGVADLWFAITEWGTGRQVAYGRSRRIKDIAWRVISTEAFERSSFGFRPFLFPQLSSGRTFQKCDYKSLPEELSKIRSSPTNTVLVTEF